MTFETPIAPDSRRVAIIGAGPAGLVAARWLAARGLEPVLFEAADDLGGQWNGGNAESATWPGMRTNTSRIVTAFSDLDHPAGTPMFPDRAAMGAYLHRYAAQFDLTRRIRLSTRVQALQKTAGGWLLRSVHAGAVAEETFARVVIANGRHRLPDMPPIPGLGGFRGALGVMHSAGYPGAARFAGARVVVAGCSISALEIATDLASGVAAEVTVAMRRQRYVIPKIMAGVPSDNIMFTRAAALAAEVLPPAAQAQGLKAAVMAVAGSPARYGAAAPEDDFFAAGLTQSQGFLPAVAEGRIRTAPWITRIDGRQVTFADGTETEADAILMGTGFRHNLPWLDQDIARTIDLGAPTLGLFAQTLHPDLPGLAFMGQFDLIGPYFPVLELQARFVAGALSGQIALPAVQAQRQAIADQRAMALPPVVPMHIAAVQFARLVGCEPDPQHWPDLTRTLMFGPLTPVSFRLEGPDALTDAAARTAAAAASLGRITSQTLAPDEAGLMAALGGQGARAA